MIYLDWAATARPDVGVMAEALRLGSEAYGNPSSSHPAGRAAAAFLDSSRASLAATLGCSPSEVVFTSGATESNWLVISSVIARMRAHSGGRRQLTVVASGVEHPSVHDNLELLGSLGAKVRLVGASASGAVSAAELAEQLDPDTVMVLLMTVNNVTGAIQPVREVAEAASAYSREHGRRIVVHTDAVQALGKIGIDLAGSGVDTASFSAHKIGGPRGAGALYVRSGTHLTPLWRGGEQEHGLRPGTENCMGAAGFAMAARKHLGALEAGLAHASRLRALLLERLLRIPGCVLLPPRRLDAPESASSPYIVSFSFPPIPSEVLVRLLASEDICVSSGSACASRSKEKRERVYRNMGVPAALAGSAIRVSTGADSTEDEVERLADVLAREVPRLARIAG